MIYIGAFEAMDADIISELSSHALVEIPLLKPNRLFGKSEILRGHTAIFASLEKASFLITGELAETQHAAICFSDTQISRNSGEAEHYVMALVAETKNEQLHRISLYFNSRNVRRWSDETIV